MATSVKQSPAQNLAELIETMAGISKSYEGVRKQLPGAMLPFAEFKAQRKTIAEWTDQLGVELDDVLVKLAEAQKVAQTFEALSERARSAAAAPATTAKAGNGKAAGEQTSSGGKRQPPAAAGRKRQPVAA